MKTPIVIVGLGNPGKEYEKTRHNIGFLVVDALAEDPWEMKKDDQALENRVTMHDKIIFLMKPQAFMNESGMTVASFLQYYKCSPSQLMVVHDDVDLPLGTIRLQKGRGSAGHKGVESVIEAVGTKEFLRLRCGIGRPASTGQGGPASTAVGQGGPANGDVERFVLEPFLSDELSKVNVMIDQAVQKIRNHLSLPTA